jgi:hypothetical protein
MNSRSARSSFFRQTVIRKINVAPLEKTIGQHQHIGCRKNSSNPMRRIAVVLISVFLVCAGATEVLKSCLTHEDHADHHHFEGYHSDSGISVTHDHSPSPSWPIIHCPPAEQRLGPALQVASASLSRLDQITSVHASFLREPVAPASKNNLWREAVFKISLTFSLPNDLARHLFLSVLQI